ncbi:hypothetical protein AgCh_031965 [Apium graveolens]
MTYWRVQFSSPANHYEYHKLELLRGGAPSEFPVPSRHCLISVDFQERSGRIALLWKEEHSAHLLSFSKHHIDVEVNTVDNQPWSLKGFYGEPDRAQRRKTWDLLRNLARVSNLPWCIIGDLNNVVS